MLSSRTQPPNWIEVVSTGNIKVMRIPELTNLLVISGTFVFDSPTRSVFEVLLNTNCCSVGSTFVNTTKAQVLQTISPTDRIVVKPAHSFLSTMRSFAYLMCLFQSTTILVNNNDNDNKIWLGQALPQFPPPLLLKIYTNTLFCCNNERKRKKGGS